MRVTDAAGLGVIFGILLSYLRPALLFASTTTTGGDTGAQIYPPWYLMTHLLPHGQLFGWSDGWYAGFPILQFYFPLVPTLQALLGHVIPYTVAFKLGTVLGTFFLPVSVYVLFRLLRLPFPAPLIGAIMSLAFLFADSFTIFGGNLASSLAGEYSYSLSLGLLLIFLGLMYRVTTGDGGHPILASVVLALTALSHGVPIVVLVLVIPVFVYWSVRHHGYAGAALQLGSVFGIALALTAFWSIPFVARLGYTTNLHWIPDRGASLVFPAEFRVFVFGALAAALAALILRDRRPIVLFWPALSGLVLFFLIPEGHVWNARFVPFWYLGLVLSTAYLVGVVVSVIMVRARTSSLVRSHHLPKIAGVAAVVVVILTVSGPIMGPKRATSTATWARWNYQGYERRSAYPEFRSLMQRIAELPPGRVMWEPSPDYTAFGTTDALMTIPYFANHPTMEGVHYESSMTTPFHFLMAAEVADRPFNPIPGLPYGAFDLSAGTEHMRLFGVRYFVAWSDRARAAARASIALRHVADAGHFAIYEIRSTGQVVIPRYQPVRLGSGDWIDTNVRWFSNRSNLDVPLVRGGPSSWRSVGPNAGRLPKRPIPGGGRAVSASVQDGRISFTTDAVGQPHWIKTSYFPNWRADGADGPYLASPSLMVVIPTQRHVTLSYERTSVEWGGLALTLSALLLLIVPPLRRRIAAAGLGKPEAIPRSLRAMWQRRRETAAPLIRYGAVSVAATTVDLGVFSLLVTLDAVTLLLAATISYLLGLVVSFLLNRRFTFAGRGLASWSDEFVTFTAISLFGLVLNNAAVALAAAVLGRQVLVLNAAKIVAAALVWLLKYTAFRRWVFPERKEVAQA